MCELPPGELASRLRQAEEGSNRRQEPSNLLHEIATKLPKWNGRTQSFELAFHGRAKLASERNLQLVQRFPQGKERLMLLCGKLEEDEYALDFAHPLSPVHAFAFFLCVRTVTVPRIHGSGSWSRRPGTRQPTLTRPPIAPGPPACSGLVPGSERSACAAWMPRRGCAGALPSCPQLLIPLPSILQVHLVLVTAALSTLPYPPW